MIEAKGVTKSYGFGEGPVSSVRASRLTFDTEKNARAFFWRCFADRYRHRSSNCIRSCKRGRAAKAEMEVNDGTAQLYPDVKAV